MGISVGETLISSLAWPSMPALTRLGAVIYLRRNPTLVVGSTMLLILMLFVVVGSALVDPRRARPLSARPVQPPSWSLPLGSDKQGRDLLAVMVAGTPLTLPDRPDRPVSSA